MRRFAVLLGVLGFVVMLSSAADAAAPSTQSNWQGEPICGGKNLKTGKVLKPCGFSRAKFEGKARKSCPAGSFQDGASSCYTCPSGYNRTANAIDGDAACSRAVSKKFFRATFARKFAKCPSGSILDLRNGGECWACPVGYGRTAAPVNEWNACGKVGARARSAELKALVCPEGTFGDPRNGGECWTCPSGSLRSSLPVTGSQACYRTEVLAAAQRVEGQCKIGAFHDPIDGGTCWSCPTDSVRSVFSVKSSDACENPKIQWKSPPRDAKSLFHIPGGDAVTRSVIAERALIDAVSRKAAIESKQNVANRRADDWALIAQEPHESGVLIGAVYGRVIDLINNGPKTKDERDLLAYFAKYVRETRQLTALQMRDVYASWKAFSDHRLATTGTQAQQFYNLGGQPPDLDEVVHGVMGVTGSGLMLGGFAMVAASPSLGGLKGTALYGMAKVIAPYIVNIKVSAGITGLQGATAVSGPLMILTGAIITGALGIDIIAKNEQAQAKIEDAMAIAKKPVVLKRLMLSEVGRAELLQNWMMMTQATKAPQVPFNVTNYAGPATVSDSGVLDLSANVVGQNDGAQQQTIQVTEQQVVAIDPATQQQTRGGVAADRSWERVDGSAEDVAIGSDGTAYIVSGRAARNGRSILSRAKNSNRWRRTLASGTRIAVQNETLWGVGKDGKIFQMSGGGMWVPVSGPKAVDIGASAKGVWIVGEDGKLYRREGNGWKRLPGKGTRVEIDWDGRPWHINEAGRLYVHNDKLQWQREAKVPVAVADLAVDMPGGTQIIGTDGNLYVRNSGNGSWKRDGSITGKLKMIGVGGGQIWIVDSHQNIYRKK